MSQEIMLASESGQNHIPDKQLVVRTGSVDDIDQYSLSPTKTMLEEYFASWYPEVDLDALFPPGADAAVVGRKRETLLPLDSLTGTAGNSLAAPAAMRQQLKHEYMVSQVILALNGSKGRFRSRMPDLCMISANDDKQAIEAWLKSAGSRSHHTARAYRKEAERFQWWAQIEAGKPLSGLTIEDVSDYEAFLADPVSRHPGKAWFDASLVDDETGQVRRGKRAPRKSEDWYPFDGPLKPEAIDFAMQVLRSMYRFWKESGYTERNPLEKRQRAVRIQNDEHHTDRALSVGTWRFVHRYIESLEDRIPADAPPKLKLELLRSANQRRMIFRALYLLGTRISELAAIKMSDFSIRQMRDGTDAYWVKIHGKGNKIRTIPATRELIEVIAAYRHTLNTFPVVRRGARRAKYGDVTALSLRPSRNDDSPLILSSSGTLGMSPSRLAGIVKETLKEVYNLYLEMERDGSPPPNVNPDQLEHASAHWMRHTSATHQSLDGVSLQHLKEILGHAKIETVLIYAHNDKDALAKEREQWRSDGMTQN